MPRCSSCGATLRTKPTDGVLGERIEGSLGSGTEAGQRRGGDDRAPGRHHSRKPSRAEDDTVDVGGEDAAVGVVCESGEIGFAGGDAGVQAGELDRPDFVPSARIRDVESVAEVEHRDVGTLVFEEG